MPSILAPVESGAIPVLDGRIGAMDAIAWSASATIDVPTVVRQANEE